MNFNQIFDSLKDKNNVTVVFENDNELLLFRDEITGLWKRKIWGAWASLTDKEISEELAQADEEISFIM